MKKTLLALSTVFVGMSAMAQEPVAVPAPVAPSIVISTEGKTREQIAEELTAQIMPYASGVRKTIEKKLSEEDSTLTKEQKMEIKVEGSKRAAIMRSKLQEALAEVDRTIELSATSFQIGAVFLPLTGKEFDFKRASPAKTSFLGKRLADNVGGIFSIGLVIHFWFNEAKTALGVSFSVGVKGGLYGSKRSADPKHEDLNGVLEYQLSFSPSLFYIHENYKGEKSRVTNDISGLYVGGSIENKPRDNNILTETMPFSRYGFSARIAPFEKLIKDISNDNLPSFEPNSGFWSKTGQFFWNATDYLPTQVSDIIPNVVVFDFINGKGRKVHGVAKGQAFWVQIIDLNAGQGHVQINK